MSHSATVGCLLGTAVGDAIGLPYEAMSKRRGQRLLGPPDRHRFFFGRGMVSDDTEHSCIVAQALAASGGDPQGFASALGWGLRWWLLGLPAGIGFATLRATAKLWLGFGPHRSGVFSAGNGPAMRVAVIGAAVDDVEAMGRLVRIATRVTHTDPKAEHGALAIALAAHIAAREEEVRGDAYVAKLESLLGEAGRETMELLRRAAASAQMGESTDAFARALGLETGVTGYMLHTVPVCIHAWLASPRDYRAAVTAMVACGGDTDTTAAIVGGIVGSAVGKEGIPAPWLEGLLEWPRSARWIEDLGTILGQSSRQHAPSPPPRAFGPWILARNAAFTLVVLAHVARRCLPPY